MEPKSGQCPNCMRSRTGKCSRHHVPRPPRVEQVKVPHERIYINRRRGDAARIISSENALLECENDHEHIVGREQMHLADEPCCWCGTWLRVVTLGWEAKKNGAPT